MESSPFDSTLFFPLSGDPIGANHFAAAEWSLRRAEGIERVTFVLSNGRHPDPTKADAAAPVAVRLAMLEASIGEVNDPKRSYLARRAEWAGGRLRCGGETLAVSQVELSFDRAVRTAEVAARLQEEGGGRINLLVGADLVRRMANPAIFSDADLHELSGICRYWTIDRGGDSSAAALKEFHTLRGVHLECQTLTVDDAPAWLRPFFEVSSTLIRQAAEAGDPLTGMVTRATAGRILGEGLYAEGGRHFEIREAGGRSLEHRSALRIAIDGLRAELLATSGALTEALEARRRDDRPHTISVVETSAGGALTSALAARSGASRYFPQSRFAYDATAKAALIGERAEELSSVSPEMVAALASAMRDAAATDFALAESGMAGPPDGERRSLKSGETWLALATPDGVHTERVQLNPFLTRQEHQLRFAIGALRWIEPMLV
ncbi:MAG: CinA family protein [SAR324 cluster bacterium]|nr:CinA family protein [SAR324 cluster bacterium]